MKKRFLSALLVLCMVLTMIPTAFATDGDVAEAATDAVAQIGDTTYATLAEAVAEAKSGDTIKLLKNAISGEFIDVNGTGAGKCASGVTFDLNGFTLTLNPSGGSSGTKTNGFRVKKGGVATVQNGKVVAEFSQDNRVKVGFANYGTLTLKDLEIVHSGDLTGDAGDKLAYTINNGGKLDIINCEITNNVEGATTANWVLVHADYQYGNTSVISVDEDSVLTGDIGVYGGTDASVLTFAGTLDGQICVETESDAAKVEVTGGSFSDLTSVIKYVQSGATINLLNDVTSGVFIDVGATSGDGKCATDVTIDLQDHTLTLDPSGGSTGTKTNGFRVLKGAEATVQNGKVVAEFSQDNRVKVGFANYGTLTLKDLEIVHSGDLTGDAGDKLAYTINNGGKLDIINCEITNNVEGATTANWVLVHADYQYGNTSVISVDEDSILTGDIGVYGGTSESVLTYAGSLKGNIFENVAENGAKVQVVGGYYTSDPTKYLATGLRTVASDVDGYKYMVAEVEDVVVEDTTVTVVPSVGETKVKSTISNTATEAEKAAADDVVEKIESEGVVADGLSSAATEATENLASSVATEAVAALKSEDSGVEVTEEDTVYLHVETYLEVQVTDVTISESGDATVTLNITPMAQVYASTEADAKKVVTEDEAAVDEQHNAVAVGQPQEVAVTETVTITVPLPDTFTVKENDTVKDVFVHHKKDDGRRFSYKARYNETTHEITFDNPNGFSEFTVSLSEDPADAVAKNITTGTYYTTLADAIAAVEDDQAIQLLADNAETVTVSKDIRFTLDENGKNFTGKIKAGRYTTLTIVDGVYTFDYDRPSSSSTVVRGDYKITVKSAKNGDVDVSDDYADKGDKVTITVDPDKGYVLESLTVTDKDGDEIKLTKKSDTKYTFTMPKSKVTVKATFVAEDAAIELPFTDVAEGDAHYDAIAFMYENGLMVGVGDGTTFAPYAELSRAMTARIFHVLEGAPAAQASNFSDVARNFWYTAAIDWASANGVISGDGKGSFFPDQAVTREQLAVMLYQYAKSKNYDVKAGAALAQPDAANVSFWAAEAVQWAVNNGIITENGVGYLAATDAATRADVAEAFMVFVQLYA